MEKLTAHFSRSEFACRCGCGADHVDMALVHKLQELRYACGFALQVTSGVRCAEYNKKLGGDANSSHVTGQAADILVGTVEKKHAVIRHGARIFQRLGVYLYHFHFDIDLTKKHPVMWWGQD